MPPKKLKTGKKMKDIRTFFFGKENDVPGCSTPRKNPPLSTEPQTPTHTRLRIMDENSGDLPVAHSHRFIVKFGPSQRKEYTFDCYQLHTVLEAIKTIPDASKKIKCADENIIIQMGKEDKETIVATHFPCSCVPEGEYLIVSQRSEKVEEGQEQFDKTVHPKDAYAVFYIDTLKGKNIPKRGLFRSKTIKQYKYLCVYGEKGITVKEALKRDGRFFGDFGNLELSDNENPNLITVPSQRVDNLHQKTFKICRPQNEQVSGEHTVESILDVAKESGRSVKKAIEQSDSSVNIEEIYERLRQQFPGLKEWMESRFPGDSYQKKLNLRKENFGKIQQSFSEVHRLKKLLHLGKSVCKVIVGNVCNGTGFVMLENLIITNAHLLKDCWEGNKLKENISVFVLFNYDEPEPHTNYFYFTAEKVIVDLDVELDYVILELKPDGQKSKQNTRPETIQVPPGLLKKFGPVPENGEACLIGHPAGEVKKIDPTCIIEPEKREQAVKDHLDKYDTDKDGLAKYDSMVTVQSVLQQPENEGINKIMMYELKNQDVATYHTFMYHGASGSLVFDAHGQLFGLHTAGYKCNLPKHEHTDPKEGCVIEFAQPLLNIFERFVMNMKKSGNEPLLKRVEKAAAGNPYLTGILQTEAMEVD